MSKYYKHPDKEEPNSSDEEGKKEYDEWAERFCTSVNNVYENNRKRKEAEEKRLAAKEQKEKERKAKEEKDKERELRKSKK